MGDLSGIIYDKKVPMKLKNKLYNSGQTCDGVWELVLGTAQTRRTAFIYHRNENANQGKNRKDRIKNETIRGIAEVTQAYQIGQDKKTLSWYWHVI